MAGPWEKYQSPAAPAPMGGPAPMTIGTPRPPDPFKVRDQQLQEEAAARAREDQGFQREKFQAEMAQRQREQTTDPKLVESERTAAFLATRVGGGMRDIAAALQADPSQAKPGVLATVAGIAGDDARNFANSEVRQRIEAAQLDVLDSALTLGTGAAYSPEQLRGYSRSYFPQLGDSEQTIADKKVRLRRLFEAAKLKAGGAAPQIDEALAMLDAPPAPTAPGANDGPLEVDVVGGRLPNPGEPDYGPWVEERKQQEAADKARVDQRVQNYDNPLSAGVAGAVDAATFGFGDEIAAGLDAFGGAMSGQGSFGDLYDRNVNVERQVQDRLSNIRPISYTGGQIVGGAAIPIGAGAQGAKQLGMLGALQGGAYGFGSGEGFGRVSGAATGAALGGAVGAGLGAVAPYAANALGKARPAASLRQQEAADALPIIEAGQRQGIPIRQPDARPSTRADFAAVEASQTGNPIVTRTLQADENLVKQRVGEVGGPGRPLDDYEMGQRVQETGKNYLARTGAQANSMYTRAEQLAGNVQGTPQRALNMLELNIDELRQTGENTNAAAIKYLEDLKADLQGGASIGKLRNIRKNMRGQLNERNLTATDTERRVTEVLGQLGQDIESILPAGAKQAFRAADGFYRERMAFKSQVIERFMGPKNNPIAPEQAAARFNTFMKSKDFGRFQRMMKEMEPGDRQDIAATVAENLGMARNGEFSLAALSTNIDKFSPRAIHELFGSDGAKAIADLKIIARAKADTRGALNNSRTGVVNERNGLRDVMFGIFGGGIAGVPGAVGGFFARGALEKITNARAARLLLNPDFTKWLRQTPQTASPAAINRHFSRLSSVAAKDAVFVADVKALQGALVEAFGQSPGRAAAQQEDN